MAAGKEKDGGGTRAKLRLFALTEGTRVSPASRIRIYELLDRLAGQGRLEYLAASYTSDSYCRALVRGNLPGFMRSVLEQFWHVWAVARTLKGAAGAEVVLIQRVLLPIWLQKLLRRIKPRVIYDFDDAVYLYTHRHAGRFSHQIRVAESVLAVSRLAAAEAAGRGAEPDKVHVIYTPVDCQLFSPRESYDPQTFTVGWIGSPATSGYLRRIWPELAEFAAKNPKVRFVLIGCAEFDTGPLAGRVRFIPWSPEAERTELPALDAGIMPLEDTPWERGKGGYKLIQYIAAGVAAVASPVGANLEIVDEGRTGLFAGDGQWGARLGELLADRGACRAMGLVGRERAREMFDYGVAAAGFISVLDKL